MSRMRAVLASLVVVVFAVAACQDQGAEVTEPLAPEAVTVPSAPAANVIATEDLAPHPESAVHDPVDDVYLVSNLGARTSSPAFSHLFDADDNGFISRVELNPDGSVKSTTTQWINSSTFAGVSVDGITGITIQGRSLYAVDRDEILVFDLSTSPVSFDESIGLPDGNTAGDHEEGLSLPNDIVVEDDGTIWLTDTGLKSEDDPAVARTNNDAVYKRGPGATSWTKVAGGEAGSSDLGCPNGIDLDGARQPLFLTFCSNQVKRAVSGAPTVVTVEGPASGIGRLDGLVRQKSGKLLFSDWRVPQGASGVLRWVSPNATVDRVTLDDLNLPADIGFDAKRQRVLIPSDGDAALKIVRGGG